MNLHYVELWGEKPEFIGTTTDKEIIMDTFLLYYPENLKEEDIRKLVGPSYPKITSVIIMKEE
jgi:hypothetical protein